MKTFYNISKPSQAIRAMINGLKRLDQDPKFVIDMVHFGIYDKHSDTCFGCAAACTLMELSGDKVLSEEAVRENEKEKFRCPSDEEYEVNISLFEEVMDDFRKGSPESLFEFFQIEMPEELEPPRFYLRTNDWKNQLPIVEKYCARIEELGY